jgi:hypothetical protein
VSHRPSPARPSAAAVCTSSAGCEAPSRKEKLERAPSSAKPVMADSHAAASAAPTARRCDRPRAVRPRRAPPGSSRAAAGQDDPATIRAPTAAAPRPGARDAPCRANAAATMGHPATGPQPPAAPADAAAGRATVARTSRGGWPGLHYAGRARQRPAPANGSFIGPARTRIAGWSKIIGASEGAHDVCAGSRVSSRRSARHSRSSVGGARPLHHGVRFGVSADRIAGGPCRPGACAPGHGHRHASMPHRTPVGVRQRAWSSSARRRASAASRTTPRMQGDGRTRIATKRSMLPGASVRSAKPE